MKNGKDVVIYIDGEPIGQATEVGIPVEMPKAEIDLNAVHYWECDYSTWLQIQNPDDLAGWQFYMRRGNRHYFRNGYFRIVVTARELKDMPIKYGELVNIKFEL